MVSSNARPGPVAGEAWDEAKMEQALAHLKDLHIQLRELRSTIPRMQQNLGGPVPVAELAAAVKRATQTALGEVDEFQKKATSPETTKVLERAKQSRARNPKGITPWRLKDHPDGLKPDP